ncbi:hypothetical protein AOLI_G00155350 [Acnodon oligacanthus]
MASTNQRELCFAVSDWLAVSINRLDWTGHDTFSVHVFLAFDRLALLPGDSRAPWRCYSNHRCSSCAMPASDTWPCNVAMEPLVSMNSAGSSDSMVSTNSGFSDDSMEHLSAEERACLMFLEETIESLQAEDDSGISNDEHDRLSRSPLTKVAHVSPVSQTKQEEVPFHDDPNKVLGKDYKSHRLLVPTPLILANGNARILKKTAEVSAPEQKAVPLVHKPNDSPSNSHHPPAMLAAADDPAHSSLNPEPTVDQSKDLADLPPSFIPEPPVKADSSNNSKTKGGPTMTKLSQTPNQKHQSGPSEMVLELIPPPTDFMDEPELSPPPQTQSAEQSFDGQTEDDKPQSAVTPPSRGPLSPSELDKLRKKASMKKAPGVAPEVAAQPPCQRISDQNSFPVSCTDGRPITAVEHGEPKSPPAVAPKPKKLPSNIILKSHKDPGPGHSLVSPGERMMANPQKVHIEALKKLGLLKADEIDSSPSLSSSPPQRIPPPHPFNTSTSAVLPIGDTAQVQSTTAEQHSAGDVQGKTDLLLSASPNPVKGGSESPVIQRGQSPKPFEIKSASLERPGVGLKSVTAEHTSHSTGQEKTNVELSPGQLRKSRPRPASAGSRKDFGIDQLPSDPSREPDVRRSLGSSPVPSSTQPSTDSQKTPRSHGMISVVFTPHSKNGEDRKQALRKLGLIRD